MSRAPEAGSVFSWFTPWNRNVGQRSVHPEEGGSVAAPENTSQDIHNITSGQYIANTERSEKEPKMHFRIRQNVVQLVRTEYDKETKKPKATVVGGLRRAKPEVNEDLKKALTPEELAEVDRWIATEQRLQALKEEVASLSLAETMTLAEQWFARQNGSEEARSVATQVVAGWQRLRGQMKKHSALE